MDYVIFKKQPTAHNGQTVVALINNEATIKKYFKRKDRVELHPANSAFQPIIVDMKQDFKIEGILCVRVGEWRNPEPMIHTYMKSYTCVQNRDVNL